MPSEINNIADNKKICGIFIIGFNVNNLHNTLVCYYNAELDCGRLLKAT